MGQSCGCSDGPQQQDRIKELEALLDSEKGDYQQLKENYEKLHEETDHIIKGNKKSSSKLKQQIKALQSEKQQAFKEMMKEKKKITKLDETRSELERKKRKMERQIQAYKQDIAKYEARESSTSKGDDDYDAMDAKSVKSLGSVTPQPQSHVSHADVESDVDEIHSWLERVTGDKKQDHKYFNKHMTELLTKLPKTRQLQIVQAWRLKHNNSLFDQIEKKLGGKTRGVPYRVLSGLLESEAEVDAHWMQECLYNDMQIDKVANVITGRTVDELNQISRHWTKEYNSSLYSMLEKLAQRYNKNTMNHLFKNLCNLDQRERNKQFQSKEKVNTIEIAKHIEWMMLTNKWKHAEKEKMCKLVTINSDAYVHALSKQYKSKSKSNEHITQYIEKKYGLKSMAGHHLTDHIYFVENPSLYFAKKILVLAESKQKFRENNLEILNIFLSQFHTNLNQIRMTFNQIHDETLRHFIKDMGSNHNSVYFLMKILDNSKRFDR